MKIGRDFGVTDDDIRRMIMETDGFMSGLEPLARAVLRAAREMTTDLEISDATFAELRSHLDEERLTDLVLAIAFYNAVVRYLGAMKIDVEPEYLGYLEEFPFPDA